MVDFLPNVENAYVIRNNRTVFDVPEEQKTTVAEQIEISFGSADKNRTTIEQYGTNGEHVKKTYYGVDGNKLGSVFLVHDKNANNGVRTSINTVTANYHDWDGNGTIDDMDTDRVYFQKSRKEQAIENVKNFLEKNHLSERDLNNGQVMSKYINDFDLDCMNRNLHDITIYQEHLREEQEKLLKDAAIPMSQKIFGPI